MAVVAGADGRVRVLFRAVEEPLLEPAALAGVLRRRREAGRAAGVDVARGRRRRGVVFVVVAAVVVVVVVVGDGLARVRSLGELA